MALRQSSPRFPLRPALLDDAEDNRKTKRSDDRSVLKSPCEVPSNAGLSGDVGEHCLRAQPELRSGSVPSYVQKRRR